jgi:hypothetical protein
MNNFILESDFRKVWRIGNKEYIVNTMVNEIECETAHQTRDHFVEYAAYCVTDRNFVLFTNDKTALKNNYPGRIELINYGDESFPLTQEYLDNHNLTDKADELDWQLSNIGWARQIRNGEIIGSDTIKGLQKELDVANAAI